MGITLRVNGKEFDGFQSVTVTAAIDEVARSFRFQTFQDLSSDINGQDECSVYIDGHKVLTGYIEVVSTSVSEGTMLEFSGRSKTADFIDCSPDVKGFYTKNKNVIDIANIVAEPFGIKVVSNVESDKIKYTAINQGETCFQYLERLCRQQGFLMTTNSNGDLVITRAGTERLKGTLNFDDGSCNITSSSATFDWSSRFSHYEVKAQSDDKTSSSKYIDKSIKRYRPTIIIAEGNISTPENRAVNHALRISGESISATVSTRGFVTNEGELFEPNKLIYFYNKYLRIDQVMLIRSVVYEVNPQGFGCEIGLIDPRAYYSSRPRVINSFDDLKELPNAEQIFQ